MRSFIALSLCLTALPAVAEPAADPDLDLLRFSNGDALHGQFKGIGEGPVVHWSGTTFQDTIQLQTDKLRRIAQETDQAKDVDTLIADLYHTPLRHLDGQ